jgi:hypothetical protein
MMNSKDRERSDDNLREVVVEVVLNAGENGVDTFDRLLDKAAHELARRDDLTAPRKLFSPGSASLRPLDAERVLDIAWDLARRGIATFDPNASGPDWPGLRRSRYSEQALGRAPLRFSDRNGFLKAFPLEAADISPDAAVYLREAAAAFTMDCLLSACVLLSIAAEGEFLKLLRVAKNSAAHGGCFSRIGDELSTTAKISRFREAMRPIQDLLPRPATEELDHNLDTIQSVIRFVRNGSGKPSGALPPSREQVYLYLQLFLPFAKQAMRLRRELNERPYPRLVRLD